MRSLSASCARALCLTRRRTDLPPSPRGLLGPCTEQGAAIDWYTRLFGRPPDLRAGEEILWDIDEHATLFIEPDAARAGAGRVTLAVSGLDALLERLATEGIEHEPIETYSNGVRHVKVPDPDGNAIALAELPQS